MVGVAAIATVVGSAPGVTATGIGVSMLFGTTAATGIVIASGVIGGLGAITTIFGGSEIVEGATGKNPVKDAVGEKFYDVVGEGSAMLALAILDLNKSLRYASKSNKESINEQIAALEKQNELNAEILVWLEYEAEHGFYPAYTDWRHKCISNIIEQISLKYADPLTIGEFEETRQPGTYEAYLTQFEIDQESADDEYC